MTTVQWDKDHSEVYRQIAAVAVPRRAEQIAALLTLLPFGVDESFRVVELASGEGRLAQAILTLYPKAHVLALDLEPSMREQTRQRIAPFGDRGAVDAFDMHAPDWYPLVDGADVVISSLCIHHLDGDEKQALFAAMGARLSPRGALLIADIILPQREEARSLFAATVDEAARAQSIAQTGSEAVYEQYLAHEWNYFNYPDSFDKPSPLFDQLLWLKAAGFSVVDCFWLVAGHAVYGGYKSSRRQAGTVVAYADAVRVAHDVTR